MTTTLRELLDDGKGSIKTGPFGTSLSASEYSAIGVPIISVGEVDYGKFILRRDTPMAPPEVVNRLPEYVLREGDIVFARKGGVDRSARVGSAQEGWFLGSDGLRIRPGTSVDSLWLAYYLSLKATREWVLRHAAGTTMLSLSGSTLGDLPVTCPSRATQTAIAAVLSALDDKIVANASLVNTADDLAGAQFAALTNSVRLQLQLRDVCVANERSVTPGVGTIKYIDISSMGTGTTPVAKTLDWSEAPSRARRALQIGDVVWATVRPNREQYFLNLDNDPRLVTSTGLIVLTATRVPWTYLYECTRHKSFVEQIVAQAEGSAYPAVRPERFLSVLLPLASQTGIDKFHAFAEPLRQHLHALSKESASLAQLRDTLLPALMSGRLRVKDAERQVEDAV